MPNSSTKFRTLFVGLPSCAGQYDQKSYNDVIMSTMASPNPGLSIVESTICTGADQRKHQSSASLPFARGNPSVTGGFPSQRPSRPVTWKMLPFDDVIVLCKEIASCSHTRVVETLACRNKIVTDMIYRANISFVLFEMGFYISNLSWICLCVQVMKMYSR